MDRSDSESDADIEMNEVVLEQQLKVTDHIETESDHYEKTIKWQWNLKAASLPVGNHHAIFNSCRQPLDAKHPSTDHLICQLVNVDGFVDVQVKIQKSDDYGFDLLKAEPELSVKYKGQPANHSQICQKDHVVLGYDTITTFKRITTVQRLLLLGGLAPLSKDPMILYFEVPVEYNATKTTHRMLKREVVVQRCENQQETNNNKGHASKKRRGL